MLIKLEHPKTREAFVFLPSEENAVISTFFTRSSRNLDDYDRTGYVKDFLVLNERTKAE